MVSREKNTNQQTLLTELTACACGGTAATPWSLGQQNPIPPAAAKTPASWRQL